MSPIIFAVVLAELFIVAWVDVKTKLIKNYWHLINLSLALICYLLLPEYYQFTWEILLFPAGYILLGFFFFFVGIMGAGDSKFLAGLNLLIPLQYQLPYLESLILATILVGAILLVRKIFKTHRELKAYAWSGYFKGILGIIKSEFSYAPVMLLAWIHLGVQIWAA